MQYDPFCYPIYFLFLSRMRVFYSLFLTRSFFLNVILLIRGPDEGIGYIVLIILLLYFIIMLPTFRFCIGC